MPTKDANPLAAAGIAGGATFGGGIVNAISTAVQNARNREFYLQNQLLNWQHDAAMNEVERLYNLPVNQVQRLIDAGINPNLMVGSPSNTANYAKSSFNNPPAATPVEWGSAMMSVNNAIQQYMRVSEHEKALEMQDTQIAELKSRETLNFMRAFREMIFGQDKQYDLEGKQSIGYWNLLGQKQQEDIQKLIVDNARKLLQYAFEMETFSSNVEFEKGKPGEQKAKTRYYNTSADYQEARKEESEANKGLIEQKTTKVEMENQWNAMTQIQRIALLNAAVEIARVNKEYAELEKQIEAAGGIMQIALKPFEVVSQFLPGNIIGQLLGLSGKGKKSK